MPTYEFLCPDGHKTDRFFKTMSSAPGEVTCPECGAVASRQLSGGAGLMFKGSGFYLTDYGKNAHRGDSGKSKDGKSEGGKSESGKSEGGKAEGGKSEGGKSEGGKSEGGKSEGTKAENPKPKAESPKPKAQSPKPKSE